MADGGSSLSLPLLKLGLRAVYVGIGRLQGRAVGFQFLLQLRELGFVGSDLSLRSCGACLQFGAALFVGAAPCRSAIEFHRQRVELLAIGLRVALHGSTRAA